jgi:hypothetical protein
MLLQVAIDDKGEVNDKIKVGESSVAQRLNLSIIMPFSFSRSWLYHIPKAQSRCPHQEGIKTV